jgi:hypothetical protein
MSNGRCIQRYQPLCDVEVTCRNPPYELPKQGPYSQRRLSQSACIALLQSQLEAGSLFPLRRIRSKHYALRSILRPRDSERRRFLGISATCLLPIAWMAFLVPVFEPGLVRAEIDNAGSLARCPLIADQAARLRCFEEARSNVFQGVSPAATSVGTWRLVRTPNPRGGPDAVSVMHPADPSQSDIDLAGLMLRCSDTGFDVLIVFLKPFPPRRHPKVKLTTRGVTVHFDATVIASGAAILLPAEAARLVNGAWQSSSELAIEVDDDSNAVRGVISLVGLGPALSLLTSNCPSR